MKTLATNQSPRSNQKMDEFKLANMQTPRSKAPIEMKIEAFQLALAKETSPRRLFEQQSMSAHGGDEIDASPQRSIS